MTTLDIINEWLAFENEFLNIEDTLTKNVRLFLVYKKVAYLYKSILGENNDLVISYEEKAYSCLLNIPNEKYRTLVASTPIDEFPIELIKAQLISPSLL